MGDTEVGLGRGELRELLRWMVLARRLDRECMALQRQGELTVYPPFEGQEAAQIGSAFALEPKDFVFPSFRELAVALVRGVDPVQYMQYHRGTWHGGPYDPRATRFGPICVPTATQISHAVGYAMGLRLDDIPACSIAYFGDGSASEGDFHEAANMAAVFRSPAILFCQNNGWAISVPTTSQTTGEIWKRAEGYGFPGVRVDGNDVLAVYRVTKDAVARAHAGDGPTLIEALTYRVGPHTTADDAARYRDDEEVQRWRALDPIERFRAWLLASGHADHAFVAECDASAEAEVARIRADVIATEPPPVEWMFDWTYSDPPSPFLREREEALGDA
ncbi:MAG: thiamine pyrophosphate-dependent dehydrogenase E1 component subunit alpha [Actinomycetota bacterium]